MSQQIREKYFETDLEATLLQERDLAPERSTEPFRAYEVAGQPGGFQRRTTQDYDRALCLLPAELLNFIRATQPAEWRKFQKVTAGDARSQLLQRLRRQIERRGTLHCLRHPLKISGCRFHLAYFRPNTGFNVALRKKYRANSFAVIRQLKYSEETEQSLDLVIFLNGLPLFTAELKNPLNGQNVEDAMAQYRSDRDPREPLFRFKRCLAHFAVDPNEVYYTTHLEKGQTYFLPFNKGREGGAGNPTPLGDEQYATSYLWEKIWTRDSILNLIQHFIHTLEVTENDARTGQDKKTEQLIFPRYHQLQAVRSMVNHARENGVGQTYLIQHSAGSGKSNTIAWLAHQLSGLHTYADEPVFDTIIVITDRRILDKQLRNVVLQFQNTPGVVQPIGDDDTSQDLKDALEKRKKIITTTLQKFPVISEAMRDFKGTKFAVLIDEAHSSMAGESTRQMNEVLAPVSLEEAAQQDDVTEEDLVDRIEKMIKSRGQLPNVSYFAFTATPKKKTLELFGTVTDSGKQEPFSLYTMRQAIEEHFILDVLENYTTYKSYFKLLKAIADDPQYDRQKASALLRSFVDLHEHAIGNKTDIIVQHFHKFVAPAIQHQAKAMVVTRSRLHAVRFFLALKKYLKERQYPYQALVAFSGTVKDPDTGQSFTESGLNAIPQAQTREQFKHQAYRFLVVANKFQTGFDEPLLHTMYVDKKLGGINAVQTLSRLNRIHPHKKDTMVLDFVNEAAAIKAAFDPYYEKTFLSESTDPNVLYNLMEDLQAFHLYSDLDIDQFASHYFGKKVRQARLYAILNPVKDRYAELSEDERRDFYRKLSKYVRTYAFLAQILPFADVDLEKLYVFGKYLLRLISLRPSKLPREVTQQVDMDSYRLQRMHKGKISLDRGEGEIEPDSLDGETGSRTAELESLSEIIRVLNERFGTDFEESDKVFQSFRERLYQDEAVQKSAVVNPPENAKLTFDDKAKEHARQMIDENFDFYKKFNDDKDFQQALLHMLFTDFQRWRTSQKSY